MNLVARPFSKAVVSLIFRTVSRMSALAMTLMIGVFVMLIVVVAFIFSAKSGQYDDLDGSAHRILMDDDDPRIPGNESKRNNKDNKVKND